MSDKQRVSASVDEPIANYLQQDVVNASGLINKLVRQYLDGNGGEDQMVQLRIDQVQSEIESLETRLSQKRTQLENLEERYENAQEEQLNQLQQAAEALDPEDLYEGNQTVQWWASELGMNEQQLIDELEGRM
jgi:flagellar capping protein FliD